MIWDGAGTTVAGTTYENTYAWIMTLNDGQVIDATAFYDSISINELWKIDPIGTQLLARRLQTKGTPCHAGSGQLDLAMGRIYFLSYEPSHLVVVLEPLCRCQRKGLAIGTR